MAGFLSVGALNNFIKLGVAGIVAGSVVNSTLYNGELDLCDPSTPKILFCSGWWGEGSDI